MKKYLSILLALFISSSVKAQQDTVQFEGETHFKNVQQLTFGGDNAEAYWSFDGKRIIFQKTNPKEGIVCDQIFMGNLPLTQQAPFNYKLVSTGKGRTTCAYFMKDGIFANYLFASFHDFSAPFCDRFRSICEQLSCTYIRLLRIQPYPAISGYIRPCPSISSHIPAISGNIRPDSAISGHTWPYPVISGHTRPYLWSYPAISGHIRPCLTISSHGHARLAIASFLQEEVHPEDSEDAPQSGQRSGFCPPRRMS